MILLLRPGQATRIRRGEVCQLRFPVVRGKYRFERWDRVEGYLDRRHPSRVLSKCGRPQDVLVFVAQHLDDEPPLHLGTMIVTDVARSRLDAVTDRDVAAEGFGSRAALFAWWRYHHDTGPLAAPEVKVVYFRIDVDVPRFLTARPPTGKPGFSGHDNEELGYQRSRDPLGAGEVVTDREQGLITTGAQRDFQLVKDADLSERLEACLDMEQRIVVLEREARRHQVSVRSEVKLCRRMLERGENPERPAGEIERRLRQRWAA